MNISSRIQQLFRDESGVLTFEWILLGLLMTIGIVGGLAAMRDVQLFQFANIADAAVSLDQSCGWKKQELSATDDGTTVQTSRCLYLKDSYVEDVSKGSVKIENPNSSSSD